MRNRYRFALAGILLLAVASQWATAQDGASLPMAISELDPPTVNNSAGRPVEGWAVVRYSVLENGRTDNVRVLDIAPPGADPMPAIEAVESWRFTPAVENGTEIDWHNNETVVPFASGAESNDPPENFAIAYSEIQAMVESEEFARAKTANQNLLRNLATSRAQIGLALAQAAILDFSLGDLSGALRNARLATDRRIEALSEYELLIALELKLRLESQFGRTMEALDTYAYLSGGFAANEENPFAELGRTLQDLWDNSEILEVRGEIEDGPWHFDVHRRMFTIGSIEGSISSLEAECERRLLSLDYQPDVEWGLPETFGDCAIYVNADPGTRFTFYEMLPPDE